MNPEIKSQWCDALRNSTVTIPATATVPEVKRPMWYMASVRSGALFSPEGLLIDIYLKAHNLQWEIKESKWTALSRSCAMPDAVCQWAGLTEWVKRRKPSERIPMKSGGYAKIYSNEFDNVEQCVYDPLLPSYKNYDLGKDADGKNVRIQIGDRLPTMGVILLKNNVSYSVLADLIEIDL